MKIIWDPRNLTYEGDLKLKVSFGVTQGIKNTLQTIRLTSVTDYNTIMAGILALQSVLSAQDKGEAQTDLAQTSYVRKTEATNFEAVLIYGVRKDSNRRGQWAFVVCRADELADVKWKVWRLVPVENVSHSGQ